MALFSINFPSDTKGYFLNSPQFWGSGWGRAALFFLSFLDRDLNNLSTMLFFVYNFLIFSNNININENKNKTVKQRKKANK